ncbi:FecR domain-containing protein [Reichenbachiella sp. MALMAid0571]|uniref:FecR family protein n=1 Tax=Reichenbachiella sp. MALMAid0571 TaxID=3143939 RepID=UPI0032DF7F7F
MEDKIDRKKMSDYVDGKFTLEDKIYIENAFRDESKQEQLQEVLKSEWLKACKDQNLEDKDLSHIFYKLYFKITNRQFEKRGSMLRSLWKSYSRVAAIILLPLVFILGFYTKVEMNQINREISYAEIIAPLGSRINFTLPDGSSGWLNSGSSLKYPIIFTDTRDVELAGEAFFDVVKNKHKPFNVKTSDLNISVLGTQFNVTAYGGDANSDVVLESGKVVLNRKGSDQFVEMKPDERVVYNSDQKVLKKSKVNSKKYSSWKEGKLVFRNDPIDEVVKRLSRWYNVDIEVNQNPNSDFRLRATFENEEIEEVMRLLKLTFDIDYKFEERTTDKNGKFEKRKIKLNLK